ncbi:MAG: formate dehydrogenase accessory sulfurtransferase FdhD [Anaerolineales bacterium]|nr:formate dehydrogenase accessory sulfurtransferase FdhD [Anaerolineales bacterium]MCS7247251.1 formate dehydrogenase accessory sulfurtransferase FdhD [Anaerolineales bacterium]MDW8161062.1 formate dehydrogenase accessory sulfurtransferase FdhD [Anaerolineales bacterium]MDW8447636.1 formate dehydrogenase accessory sulfurtransferase FdhD [Anaerolineales bacterium]
MALTVSPYRSFPILLVQGTQRNWQEIPVVAETSLTLTVNGEEWLTFLCTPLHQIELAIGFLYNENIISGLDDIVDYRLCESGNNVDIWLKFSPPKPRAWTRTSGCSGGSTLQHSPKHSSQNYERTYPIQSIYALIDQLYHQQSLYKMTGGIHTSALCNTDQIVVSVEDIGRHNTLDKLAGIVLLHHLQLDHRIIITTGRVSSEMMQKAIRLGCEVVISRTSPSALAVQLAQESGITLIGYAKRSQFNLYTHPQRLTL